MDTESKIIVIRKQNKSLAYQAFVDLMKKTEQIMNDKARSNPNDFRKISPSELECCSVDAVKFACSDSPFKADEVQLVSGQKFPDIVANKYYGIEVKQTKSNSWISTGSSIVETTRVDSVDDIYMLFGNLGGTIPKFKCRPYQDVLCDIAVTHSPRYLINMELGKNETIFAKMGTTYDTFRKSDDLIAQVRCYYRERAIQQNRQEMPWWITSDNVEQAHSFNITLWNSLEAREKRELQAKCMILFPEALNPASSKTKYNNTTLWLCSYCQVVNPNIRDLYSAGGKITHVNGKRLASPAAQVFKIIVEYAEDIKAKLANPTLDLCIMIKEFNPALLRGSDMYEQWLTICCGFASKNNVPLRDWIKNKPDFSFSKK